MSLDLSYLDKMTGGDINTKKTMLELMQQEITKDLPKLLKLYQAKDWEQIERFCHHFKSTIVFSGNDTLIRANEKLWGIAKSNGQHAARAEALIQTITSEGKRVNREIAQLIKTLK